MAAVTVTGGGESPRLGGVWRGGTGREGPVGKGSDGEGSLKEASLEEGVGGRWEAGCESGVATGSRRGGASACESERGSAGGRGARCRVGATRGTGGGGRGGPTGGLAPKAAESSSSGSVHMGSGLPACVCKIVCTSSRRRPPAKEGARGKCRVGPLPGRGRNPENLQHCTARAEMCISRCGSPIIEPEPEVCR